jgi:hypothetical protein
MPNSRFRKVEESKLRCENSFHPPLADWLRAPAGAISRLQGFILYIRLGQLVTTNKNQCAAGHPIKANIARLIGPASDGQAATMRAKSASRANSGA